MNTLVNDLLIHLLVDYDCIELVLLNRHFRAALAGILKSKDLFRYRAIKEFADGCYLSSFVVNCVVSIRPSKFRRRTKVSVQLVRWVNYFEYSPPKQGAIKWLTLYFKYDNLLCIQYLNAKAKVVVEMHTRTGTVFPLRRYAEYFNNRNPSRILDYDTETEYVYRRDGSLRFKRPSRGLKIYFDRKGKETHSVIDPSSKQWQSAAWCVRTHLSDPLGQGPDTQPDDTS